MSEENQNNTEEKDKSKSVQVSHEKIREFLGEDFEGLPNNKTEEKEETTKDGNEDEKVKIPPDETFSKERQTEQEFDAKMLTNIEPEVTDFDKRVYLKAILNDEPVHFKIELMGGNFSTTIKSRNTYEQSCIFQAVSKDEKSGKINSQPELVSTIQRYTAAVSVIDINGKDFGHISLDPDAAIDDNISLLRNTVKEKIYPISTPKWLVLSQALGMFDAKLYKLNNEASNSDFWQPPR